MVNEDRAWHDRIYIYIYIYIIYISNDTFFYNIEQLTLKILFYLYYSRVHKLIFTILTLDTCS